MAKKIFLGALVLFLSASIFSAVAAKKIDGTWRLDGLASDNLRNFRLMTDAWKNSVRGKEPTRKGLENLRASASAQPSLIALAELHEKISALAPDAKIFMIDLRQESHGFANSLPVSWYNKHNTANAGKNTSAVLKDETERLKNLRGNETTFTPLGNDDKKRLKEITIIPRVTQTERDVAESAGFEYKRFAAADMQFPAPEIVDDFDDFPGYVRHHEKSRRALRGNLQASISFGRLGSFVGARRQRLVRKNGSRPRKKNSAVL